ncbi:MAG: UDP-N-acetylglucosamine 2-epimerase (non-hydrolyzing) [Chloroflexota bacterium]
MKIIHVVGARPNFMKIAPVMQEMANHPNEFEQMLVHTGQHYDAQMSEIFFNELELPRPNINLEVGSGSHAIQTARIMERFESIILDHQPDWIMVPGDVNSTMACTLVASKLGVKVAHLEAGLRSFDRSMPEEINRLVTDQLADLLLTPSRDGDENLLREGIAPKKIHFVGNVMIDTLVRLRPKSEERWPALQANYGLDQFVLATLHRPGNVDEAERLRTLIEALEHIASHCMVLFPVHPRTRQRMAKLGIEPQSANFQLIQPLGYLDFLALQAHARLVLTDSGGVQEETTYLGTPCFTVRPNTERPVTITHGTNQLIQNDREVLVKSILDRLNEVKQEDASQASCPDRWDGCAAARVVDVMRSSDTIG